MRTVLRLIAGAAFAAGMLAVVFASLDRARPQVSSGAQASASANISQGQRTFLEHCAMCHGDGGLGDGELAGGLKRRAHVLPANLTDRGRLDRLGHAGVRRVIERGGAHTGRSNLMPAWGERLSSKQIDEVTDFVMSLPDAVPDLSTIVLREYLSSPPGVPADGRRLFVHHCAACHGSEGRGDGTFAAGLKATHHIQPRNLTDSTYLAQKTDRVLFATIKLGGTHVGKSPYMPVWGGYLTPDQIKDLVSYIRVISHTAAQQ